MIKGKINYLFVTVALLVVISIGMFVVSYFLYTDSVAFGKQQFIEQQNKSIEEVSGGIKGDINFLIRELDFLTQRPEIKNKDIKKVSDLLLQTFKSVEKVYVNDIGVLDSNGNLLVNVTAPQIIGTNFAFREYFKQAKTAKAGEPSYEFIEFKGADVGQKGITIAIPFFSDSGNFNGVVLFTIKVGEFVKNFDIFRSLNSKLWAMDADGLLLYHPNYKQGTPASELDAGSDGLKSFLKEVRLPDEIERGSYFLNGENFMFVSSSINVAGKIWTLVIETPEKKMGELALLFIQKQVVLIVVVLLLIIAVSFSFIYIANKKTREEETRMFERVKVANKNMEAEIQERKKTEENLILKTKELDEKNKRLEMSEAEAKKALELSEKAGNLMAGRELKMRELKLETMALKEKLKKYE